MMIFLDKAFSDAVPPVEGDRDDKTQLGSSVNINTSVYSVNSKISLLAFHFLITQSYI